MASSAQLTLQEWLYFCGARDETGAPVASGFAYFYEPGSTSVAITVYSNITGTPLSQPVALDAAGRAEVYAVDEYECIVKDALGTTKRLAVRAGQTSATAVDTVFRSADAKLQAVLTTIGAELDVLNAAAAAAVPMSSVNEVFVSTASPSFAFDHTKRLNLFQVTYAGAVGTVTITWIPSIGAAYREYMIVIQTQTTTTATDVTFPADIHAATIGPLVAGTSHAAIFHGTDSGGIVQVSPWVATTNVYW